jgi:putative addiction module component (TIGR02574 family)
MAQSLPLPPPGFDDLPVEEKLDYVQSLWDRIAARPDEVPVPDWHREIIAERLAAHRADPGAARPWDEVREELLEELRNRPRQG